MWRARLGSATLTAAVANIATFHATSTVSSPLERTEMPKPSFRSCQWPRLGAVAACRSFAGMPASNTAESKKVAELIQ